MGIEADGLEKEKKTGQRKGKRKGADEKNLGNGG